MPEGLTILVDLLIATAVLSGGLAVIGFPIRALLLDGPEGRSPVPSVVVGLAVVQIVGWYWIVTGHDGLRGPMIVLLVLGALGSGFALLRRGVPRPRFQDTTVLIAIAGTLIAFVAMYWQVFNLGTHTPASLGNLDVASYSIVGQHLAERGFDDGGQIGGIGDRSKWDAFGSTVLLGASSAVTGVGVWKLALPVILIFLLLSATTLARLLNELFPKAPLQAGFASVAASVSFLGLYVVGHYFLGQVMAAALIPILCVAALRARDVVSWRAGARLSGAVAVVVVVFLSHYFHMLPPTLAFVGLAGVAASGRAFRTAVPKVAGVLTAGLLLGALIVPEMVKLGVDRGRMLSSVQAGFALPGFTPFEIAGAMDGKFAPSGTLDIVLSVVLLGAVLAALFALRRTHGRVALFAGVMVALILLSYLVLYLIEGASYRQWKWITYFQPLYAALVFMVLCMGIASLWRSRPARWVVAGSCGALAGLALVLLAYGGMVRTRPLAPFQSAAPGELTFIYVDRNVSNLEVNPVVEQAGGINVDIVPWWETMWAIYFLRDHAVTMQSVSYFGVNEPTQPWTLVPRSALVSGSFLTPVNDRYELERRWTGPTSVTGEGLDATLAPNATTLTAASKGVPVLFGVAITNTGTSAWLPSGESPGAVNLEARFKRLSGGRPVGRTVGPITEVSVIPARTRVLPPGGVAHTAVSIPAPRPGRYELQLEMAGEGSGTFGPVATVQVTVQDD
ncbi:hypothetical protein OJ997_18880 [Solirubrobacter phytolaccae]|uniref:Uncharacterized protein n=1 Tax=Solirubrobacter phytolaccae TaxID=1404360 RepID=A0A9X3N9D5_9ACTN|nr:hypothetical protein [Solirubrobacter phytolaccae]MDA0182380.1 hypothetical protein [Solirubrobacter phytolaccae]